MYFTRYSCQLLKKVEFSLHIFVKSSDIKFHKNSSSGGAELFHADRQTDGHHKLIVAFHNSAKVPNKQTATLKISLLVVVSKLPQSTLCFWCRFCNFPMYIVMNMNAKATSGRKNAVQFILTTSCADRNSAAKYQSLEIIFSLSYGFCTVPCHSHIITY
jgi:hypothetical protein